MATLEQIKARAEAAVPGARLEIVLNAAPCAQHSLLVDTDHALAVARFLRDDPQLRLDYASNVTGIDWPETVTKQTRKVKQIVDGVEKEIEETIETKKPGYLEAVYHLYSMVLKHGPVILRLRSGNRTDRSPVGHAAPVLPGARYFAQYPVPGRSRRFRRAPAAQRRGSIQPLDAEIRAVPGRDSPQ